MKKIVSGIITFIFILPIYSQIDIEVPPCKGMSKEDKKAMVKAIKNNKGSNEAIELPANLFGNKVMVFIVNRAANNVENVIYSQIEKKGQEGNYSFTKTVEIAKEACKKAGLNVTKYVICEGEENYLGLFSPISHVSEDDMKEAKDLGINYTIVITGIKGERFDFTHRTLITNVNNSEEIYYPSLKKLYENKNAKASNYKEGTTENRINSNTTYGGAYKLPQDIKSSAIYFVKYPNLILPKEKADGSQCQAVYYSHKSLKEKYKERNTAAIKVLPTSSIKINIVDKISEISSGKNVYVLKYHEYISGYQAGTNSAITYRCFYLENTETKRIYAFNESILIDYQKKLKKIVKTLNEL